jgi:putative spermidine/putrescine transport system ATP-binding protein
MIAGFEEPSAGRILFDGVDVTYDPANRRGIGFVFQSYALFPHLTCLDNVAFSLQMQRVPKATRRHKAQEFLRLVHMEAYADRWPAQLSGGQQQRVALARARSPSSCPVAGRAAVRPDPFWCPHAR